MLDLSYTALVTYRAVYAAAKLGIADLLSLGAKNSAQIARATATDPRSMYRLLRALASSGIFIEHPGRRFELTPLGSTLRSDAPSSLRGWVIFSGAPFYLHAWEEIVHSVRTGRPAWDRVYGVPFFDYLAKHPEAASIFDEAMASLSTAEAEAVTEAYDFSRFRVIVDVGGGQGTLLATILRAHPHLRGILYDRRHVIERGRRRIEGAGLAMRVDIVQGDFFEDMPKGGDAYVLKYIIHDWEDDRAVTILRNGRRGMSAEGTLLLIEAVIAPPGDPDYTKLSDLEMLVLLGSKERTLEEYRDLLTRGGFELNRVVRTRGYLSILEATPR